MGLVLDTIIICIFVAVVVVVEIFIRSVGNEAC